MAHSNTRYEFSQKEYEEIRELTRQKLAAPSDKQKGIRAKLRSMGFYWDDYHTKKTPFNLETLEELFSNGTLSIMESLNNSNSEQQEVKKSKDFDSTPTKNNGHKGRKESDEAYVIDLCDEILDRKASRQHRFDFLTGDSGRTLPVDAFYSDLHLVIEFYEKQHSEEVKFFDRKPTVSGVTRGEQRKIYDERRKEVLPKHGIDLVVISYKDFGDSKKLKRNKEHDLNIIRNILKDFLV